MAYRYRRDDEPTQAEIEQMYLDLGLGHILEQETDETKKNYSRWARAIVAHQDKIREITNDKQS